MAKSIAPKSLLSRSKELFSLGTKIALEEISHQVSSRINSQSDDDRPLRKLQVQVEQAKMTIETLGRLKGAAMKVGQMISIEAQDFLPPEVIEVLSKLQNQTPGLEAPQIREMLARELGADWETKIEELSPAPIAAASIGQVHSAVYRGKKIALKIQYPGICDSIDSDLTLLKKICQTMLGLSSKKIDLNRLFQELEDVFKMESDYLREGKNLGVFAEIVKDRPEFCLPVWIPEISTSKILAMSFEDGLGNDAFLATRPSAELRNEFGQMILDLYSLEFFGAGLVQTDPNFANFLFRPETKQIVLLDFGAVREYDSDFRRDYKTLLRLIRKGDDVDIVRHSVAMGLVHNTEEIECLNAFCTMLKKSLEPFEDHVQPFRFADSEYSNQIRKLTIDFTRSIRFSPPPHQLIFLHRKLGGIFSLLKKMDCTLDLRPYWDRLVS